MIFGDGLKKLRLFLKMKFKKAKSTDLLAIFKLLQAVVTDLRAKGIHQWNDTYPTLNHVEDDIRTGALYIGVMTGKMVGVICLDENQSPEYETIPWQFKDGKIMVVHRLAVSPDFQKQGIGKALMDFALNHAIANNYAAIRLDAYSKNERTLNFYRNRNYHHRGEIYFPYRDDPFYCFEKAL